MELLTKKGYKVEERLLSVDELKEAWGTGTAAVVSPIGELSYDGEKYTVAGGKIGPLTQWLYDTLTGIQWGKTEDPYGWTELV